MARRPPTPTPSPSHRLFDTLGAVLSMWRATAPNAPALITPERTWSVAELADLADRQRAGIAQHAGPGARVAVHAANSAEFVALLYSVPMSGRVLVPLNTRLAPTELTDQLARARVALLVGDPVEGYAGPRITIGDLSGDAAGNDAPRITPGSVPPAPNDVAWVIFTSGSTGKPKGVLLTHASLAAAVGTTAACRPLAEDEVYLYPFPLFHISTYNVVHAHARRRPVVLPARFDAPAVLDMAEQHAVTAMSLTATMLQMLLDALSSDPERKAPGQLRTIAYGAAPLSAPLLIAAAETLGCGFAQGYGMTELSGNAVFLSPTDHQRALAGEARLLGAAGYPGPGVELRIVDDTGTDLPDSQPGEVCVAADQVCAGYLDDPNATAESIRDGWLHTGDVGILDSDGLLRIVDRAKDIVVSGGENVASREVEDALATHPAIGHVAVIATPDERWGEAVTACVVLRDRGDERPVFDDSNDELPRPNDGTFVQASDAFTRHLAGHVSHRIAGYKKPRRVFIGTELPLNAAGKVDKVTLRAMLRDSALEG